MIKIDVAKAGAQLFNLSSLFNARVHDGFTPVKAQWVNSTDSNKPLDVKNMKAFLKGRIGQGTIKDDHVELEPKSDLVSWEDDGSGSQPNGITLIKLPPQVFTRDGVFYGYIGLMDTNGTVITSINIWFNVDQNIMTAGANVPYYLDEIQAALSAIQRANDTLQRAKQEIDNQINLSQVYFQPEGFENETALKAKYPAGASGLMVTVDTGHKWLWIKGAWIDCGPFQTASLGFFNQLPGINLIDGTSTDTQHVGPGIYGKDSNVIDVSRRLDSNLTWSFSIKNLTGNVFVKVKYMDQVGDFLNLDGSINNDAQFGTATGYIVKSGINVTHFTIPDNATSMIVTLACDTKSEFDIANSMLTYGIRQMPWKPSLKDSADPARQIAQMIANLDDLLNAKKVDVAANTHLNLLHISPNTWTHAVGSHDSDWVNWDPQTYGNLLTYAVKLKHINSANDHGVYFTIRMIDSVGTPIDLSGKEISTAYTNVVVSPDNIKTNTDYVRTIALPANAARVSMTITTADTSDSYDYCDETIIAGSRADMPLENFDNDDNLIPNTHAWESHIGPGLYAKQTDWFDVTGGRKLYWSITIANATDSFYPAIILKDSKGNQINLDGTAGDNRLFASPLENQEYTATAQKQFVWNVNLPSNAAEASLVVQFKSDKLEMDYCNEIANYASVQEWKPKLSDLSKNEQIERLLEENNSSTTSTSMSLATINLTGDTDKLLAKNQEVTLQFSLQQPCQNIKGYVKMQWQGNSSLGWAKKGFKLKTYQDASCTKKLSFRPKPSFYKSNKWHLKGYMTDRYTVRDSTAAEIYTNFIVNNPTAPAQLLSANHYGTIQSMPVLLYMNDKFYGLMELNTKSGGELWNIADDDDTAMALESNGGINSNWTTQTGVLNGADYEVQAGSGKNGQALLDRIGKLAAGMSDADFVKNFEQYINLNSALDYVIFNYWINNDDSWGSKNIVYLTYDGMQTYLMPYDFDSTMMAGWVPGKQTPIDEDYFSDNAFLKNNLIKKIITLMPDKLLKRFNELNSLGVLDVAQAARLFRDKVNEIGSGAYSLDAGKWEAQAPDAYSDKAPSIDQICYMFIKRKQLLNDKLKDQVSKL